MAKTYSSFPPVICQRLRNLVKAEKDAESKRQDLFDARNHAEEELNSTPSNKPGDREHQQAEYGRCVLEIKRWDKAIAAIRNDKNDLIEQADEPGLYDDADVHIDEFMERTRPAPKKPSDDAGQMTMDDRPVGRPPKNDAPVAVGENQHLAASILELGLPDRVVVELKAQGFETVNHLVLHQNKGKRFIEIHRLSETSAAEIEKALGQYLKKHSKVQVDKDLGRGDEPVRNAKGGPHWRADAKDLCDECADTKRDEEGT